MPGVFGPKTMPGGHEERDRREPDASTGPREQAGGEERAAEGDERVLHQVTTTARKVDEVLRTADDHETIADLEHGRRIRRDDRRVAPHDRGDRHARRASDLEVGDRTADAGDRSCNVTQSMSRPPMTASTCATAAGLKYTPARMAPSLLAWSSVKLAASGSPRPATQQVEVPAAGVMHDDRDHVTGVVVQLIAPTDAGQVLLGDGL